MTSKFGRFGQLWKPNQENFHQQEKLKLNTVRMCTISSEDIEKWHAVARELEAKILHIVSVFGPVTRFNWSE